MQRNELERLARSGDLTAQIELGGVLEKENRHAEARATFANAAKANAQGALRRLALNLLLYPPRNQIDGVNLLKAAGDQGDAEALHMCAMVAVRDEKQNDRYNTMLSYLVRAANLGHETARKELLVLAEADDQAQNISDWNLLRNDIRFDPWLEIPEKKSISAFSRLEVFEAFLRPELCDWLISIARPTLKRAQVYDFDGRALFTDFRTNTTGEFTFFESDALFSTVQDKIGRATGVLSARMENASVLHYNVGEKFDLHFDFLDQSRPGQALDIAQKGQRIATFLIYLNDDFEGGETDFPHLDIRYRGKKGDALLFWNLDHNGAPDRNTQHAGLAPTKGEKWLFSQWLREPMKSN